MSEVSWEKGTFYYSREKSSNAAKNSDDDVIYPILVAAQIGEVPFNPFGTGTASFPKCSPRIQR